VNLAKIRSAILEIFQSQTKKNKKTNKKVPDSAKTELYLRAVKRFSHLCVGYSYYRGVASRDLVDLGRHVRLTFARGRFLRLTQIR